MKAVIEDGAKGKEICTDGFEFLRILQDAQGRVVEQHGDPNAQVVDGHLSLRIMQSMLALRGSASAAILHYAYAVAKNGLWHTPQNDFDGFAAWMDAAVDREQHYTLWCNAYEWATVIAPWLASNHVTNPETGGRLYPEQVLATAGYSRLADVKASMIKKEHDKPPEIIPERAAVCLALATSVTSTRTGIDETLKELGWRKARNPAPDTLHGKVWTVDSPRAPISLTIKGLDPAELRYLTEHVLVKYLSLAADL